MSTSCFLPGDSFTGMEEQGGAGDFNNHSGGQEVSANGSSASQGGISVPDFLPPAQRVLFMRIQQKQQEEEERARRMTEGGADRSKDVEGKCSPSALTRTCFCLLTLRNVLPVSR